MNTAKVSVCGVTVRASVGVCVGVVPVTRVVVEGTAYAHLCLGKALFCWMTFVLPFFFPCDRSCW